MHYLRKIYCSPCTEEIAAASGSRIIRDAGKRFVVMDTAPTGVHYYFWMQQQAYHKEIIKKMGEKGHWPMMQLQDPERTKVIITTLKETTPEA